MATIKQIAQQVGVAPSTVSRVLSHDNSMSVNSETRALIIDTAERLNYQSPRQRKQAKINAKLSQYNSAFVGNDQLTLAVVHFLTPSEELGDPFYTSIRIGIEHYCHKHNIALRNTFKTQLAANRHLLSESQAVICVGHFSEPEAHSLYSMNKNLIFIDSNPLQKLCDSVQFDRTAAAEEVMSYILKSGAIRPAFIGNRETRLHVFRRMTQAHGVYREALCKVSRNFCIESGYVAMSEMLQQAEIPDVVFASTDIVAIGVYRAIQENNLRIPDDIKVVGMNDIPTSAHLNPSLSSMRLYPKEMGEAAVDLFLELVVGREYKKDVMLGYQFIWRDSFSEHAQEE